MAQKDLHEANRTSWNAATKQHNTHKGDQAKWLREGGNTLYPEETELLGDVRGKTLVHLQCNSGQDTLSIASHLGAEVTGVDISDEAIHFAQRLAQDSGIGGTFVRSDVYDWLDANTQQYDRVFASYGAIIWLSDLKAWGAGVAQALKPGGSFVLVEFHPVYGLFEDDWALTYDYMGGAHIAFDEGIGDYVAFSETALLPEGAPKPETPTWTNANPSHEFTWGLADIVMALVNAGLRLDALHEYPYSNGFKRFDGMRLVEGKRWIMPEGMPVIPLMYGIKATKPA